jgi:hypothetical protein
MGKYVNLLMSLTNIMYGMMDSLIMDDGVTVNNIGS